MLMVSIVNCRQAPPSSCPGGALGLVTLPFHFRTDVKAVRGTEGISGVWAKPLRSN